MNSFYHIQYDHFWTKIVQKSYQSAKLSADKLSDKLDHRRPDPGFDAVIHAISEF